MDDNHVVSHITHHSELLLADGTAGFAAMTLHVRDEVAALGVSGSTEVTHV